MAAVTCSAAAVAPLQKEFLGSRTPVAKSQVMFAPLKTRRGALSTRCDFIGSTTNLVVVASTAVTMAAGRFGLIPMANAKGVELDSRDPAGFSGTDVLAFGVLGHIFGVGIALAIKYFE